MFIKRNTHVPDGMKDVLFEETYNLNNILCNIGDIFTKHGYFQVKTPTFENYDMYSKKDDIIKFVDKSGDILAMRPDFTTSIARILGSKLQNMPKPIRIQYSGSAFRQEDEAVGIRQREFTQIGIELVGENSSEADAEIIATTIKAVKSTGLEDFMLEIGNEQFFTGLMEEAKFDSKKISELKNLIDRKSMGAIEKLLEKEVINSELKEIILNLPNKFGGIEVVEELKKYTFNKTATDALNNLTQIYEILDNYGVSKYISIDLGLVQQFDYYTGVIIKGFAKGVGFPFCGGGRYDNLIGEFGESCPATGIAIGIERLISALEKSKIATDFQMLHTYVTYEKGTQKAAFAVAEALRSSGLNVATGLSGGVIPENVGGVVNILDNVNIEIINPIDNAVINSTVLELVGDMAD